MAHSKGRQRGFETQSVFLFGLFGFILNLALSPHFSYAQVLDNHNKSGFIENTAFLGIGGANWESINSFARNPAALGLADRPTIGVGGTFRGTESTLSMASVLPVVPGIGMGMENTIFSKSGKPRESRTLVAFGSRVNSFLRFGLGPSINKTWWGPIPSSAFSWSVGVVGSPRDPFGSWAAGLSVHGLAGKRKFRGDPIGDPLPTRGILSSAVRLGSTAELFLDFEMNFDKKIPPKDRISVQTSISRKFSQIPLKLLAGMRYRRAEGVVLSSGASLSWGRLGGGTLGFRPAELNVPQEVGGSAYFKFGKPELGLKVLKSTFRDKLGFQLMVLHVGVSSWKVDIQDDSEISIHSIGGRGAPPHKVFWDGLDSNKNSLPDGDYVLKFEVKDRQGRTYRSAKVKVRMDRTGPIADIAARPRLILIDEGKPTGIAISQMAEDVSGISEWASYVLDEQGKLVHFFRGSGQPWTSLFWDGKMEDGGKLQPGKIYTLAFRVVDTVGNTTVVRDSGFAVADASPKLLPMSAFMRKRGLVLAVTTGAPVFGTCSAELGPDAYRTLQRLAEILRKYPEVSAQVEGHTDNQPLAQGCQYTDHEILSLERAKAVVEHLSEYEGVSREQLKSIGLGATKPIVMKGSPEDLSKNNRVEIILAVTEEYLYKSKVEMVQ